jgi:uncharacterized protein YjbJ (UPF0337 family)
MNWDRMEGEWKQRRGKAVQNWGELMNDDLAAIAGKHKDVVRTAQRVPIVQPTRERVLQCYTLSR